MYTIKCKKKCIGYGCILSWCVCSWGRSVKAILYILYILLYGWKIASGKCTELEVFQDTWRSLPSRLKMGLPFTHGRRPANVSSGHHSHHWPIHPTSVTDRGLPLLYLSLKKSHYSIVCVCRWFGHDKSLLTSVWHGVCLQPQVTGELHLGRKDWRVRTAHHNHLWSGLTLNCHE